MTRKVTGCILLILTAVVATFGLPHWLLRFEVLTVMTTAAVYSVTAFRVKVPAWVMCQEFRGVVMVGCGCLALFIPVQYLLSAWLVGSGARLVMTGFAPIGTTPHTAIRQAPGDLVLRKNGQVVKS